MRHYEDNALTKTPAFVEWVGETRMPARLREKAERLQGVRASD